MKRKLLVFFAQTWILAAWPAAAHAAATALQIQPLQYEDALQPGKIKSGYVDVSNPGDATVHIVTRVQGFRQTGTSGDLKFFDDPDLSAAVIPALTDFTLGPHEAARVPFTVDPSKLAQGGIYAAIFFRTVPPDQSSASSFISQSANVGTLLNLTYGTGLPRHGEISALHLRFWQLGSGLRGGLTYKNTGTGNAVGYKPRLTMRVLPWGHAPTLNSGLVLPGSTREFPIARAGSFAGLLPITFTDLDTHKSATRWVLALSGWYAFAGWVLLAALLLAGLLALSRPKWLHRRLPVA